MRAIVITLVAALLGGATAAAEPAGDSPCSTGRYRGPAVSLDVKDADLHNLFRFLADAGNVDIVVPDDVKGSVTLRLRRVPWEQALCTVARVKKLEVRKDLSIYYVSPRDH